MRSIHPLPLLIVSLLLCACGRSAPTAESAPAAAGEETDALPAFVGTIWFSTTPEHAPGRILVFLPDKTVLQDSCFETYRVSRWGVLSDTRIRWIEDSIPIEAEFSQPSNSELVLRPVGTDRQENYVEISAPYVCPDMPG